MTLLFGRTAVRKNRPKIRNALKIHLTRISASALFTQKSFCFSMSPTSAPFPLVPASTMPEVMLGTVASSINPLLDCRQVFFSRLGKLSAWILQVRIWDDWDRRPVSLPRVFSPLGGTNMDNGDPIPASAMEVVFHNAGDHEFRYPLKRKACFGKSQKNTDIYCSGLIFA